MVRCGQSEIRLPLMPVLIGSWTASLWHCNPNVHIIILSQRLATRQLMEGEYGNVDQDP